MPRPTKPPIRRVALLIEASRAYARGLVRGVARFNRQHMNWAVAFTPRGLDDAAPRWLRDWEGDGILARINDRKMARAIAAKGVPVVELRRAIPGLGFPSLGPDDGAVARLVFDHFRERGFRNFAFFGAPRGQHPSFDQRADTFAGLVQAIGGRCAVMHVAAAPGQGAWRPELRPLIRWLRQLPPPVAVMACNDDLGLVLLEACRRAGLLVPDEVAVAGVGNDECLCSLASPALTSVDLDPQRIGYQAAALLEVMMSGRSLPAEPRVSPPRGIITRASTDVLATSDPGVVEAVRFIRLHACNGICVPDVLRHAHMSRAALEPRFKAVLGRTIHQEIRKIQVQRVCELLAQSEAPLKQVAAAAGFKYPEYMMRVFNRATGTTPTQFRRQSRTLGYP